MWLGFRLAENYHLVEKYSKPLDYIIIVAIIIILAYYYYKNIKKKKSSVLENK